MEPSLPPRLFYDGHCALCHRAVRLVLQRDRRRPPVLISPIGGEAYSRLVPDHSRESLPDSVVVLTPDGGLLVRSQAALYLMRRLSGAWRILAALGALVPRRLGDRLYDAVARRRRRWFGTTDEVCPALPPALRGRFEP